MKPDITKHLSRFDFAMIGNLFPLTEDMVHDIMLDKGDIDEAPIIKNVSSMRPKGKSMKAADRRKKTFHKHEQREKQYKNLGYHVEYLAASERGKLREGVGAFPKGQHMNSMYNRNSCEGDMRGYRKESKHITTKQAIDMMAHEEWLDEQEDYRMKRECRMYELHEAVCYLHEMEEQKTIRLDKLMREVEDVEGYLSRLLAQVEDANNSIKKARDSKNRLLETIERIQRELNK
jgi:hypothetical protein